MRRAKIKRVMITLTREDMREMIQSEKSEAVGNKTRHQYRALYMQQCADYGYGRCIASSSSFIHVEASNFSPTGENGMDIMEDVYF